MSGSRARANQKLYHGKILIEAWRLALQQEEIASSVLEQAFGEPVCEHLLAAYGWFLLEVAQPAVMPAVLPRCCSELPPVEEGLRTAPEILEFAQLEREPWLERLVVARGTATAVQPTAASRAAQSQNLALDAAINQFDPGEAQITHDRLQTLFDRMTDSLDEY